MKRGNLWYQVTAVLWMNFVSVGGKNVNHYKRATMGIFKLYLDRAACLPELVIIFDTMTRSTFRFHLDYHWIKYNLKVHR